MSYKATIIADSISPEGERLTTMEVVFPRFILAEINTHKIISKSSASSRAIPIQKVIDRVRENPFIPEEWGSNKPGMQAGDPIGGIESLNVNHAWQSALDSSLMYAERLKVLGVHKQLVNRLLEPFMWHTALLTATEWDNFFALRTHSSAQPEMQKTALTMRAAYDASKPTLVEQGGCHLPYITQEERSASDYSLAMVSAARCARVSYLNHEGTRDISKDLDLANKLIMSGHFSPFEHVAMWTGNEDSEKLSNLIGWEQFRKNIPDENNYQLVLDKSANLL